MLLSTSVVMMRQGAAGLICTSPVSSPTSNLALKSLNFWLLMVLMGDVYTALDEDDGGGGDMVDIVGVGGGGGAGRGGGGAGL